VIGWAELNLNTPITLVVACKINTGIVSANGVRKNHCARIYVDNALLHEHSKLQILMKLATLIEAIFVVMGNPDTIGTGRQYPLAMNKCEELIVGPVQTMLGLVINAYKLTVGIPDTYVRKVLLLLNSTWHPGRKQFTIMEAQKLTGKLGHLAQGPTWIFHLLSHLYASIAHALSENKRLLFESSKEFQNIVLSLKKGTYLGTPKDEARHISFAMKLLDIDKWLGVFSFTVKLVSKIMRAF
jgi:hypothetical protein